MTADIHPSHYRRLLLSWIEHKIILSRTSAYKMNMAYQKNIGRLAELRKWLNGAGKLAPDTVVFRNIKMYKAELYKALPHEGNKAYASSLALLTEIFE